MKLTARSEYALLALVYLARNSEISHIPVETIAKAQGIPPRFLEQILLSLKRAHVVRSVKGQRGGYSLARPATRSSSQISSASLMAHWRPPNR